ncbi:hypothetical protein PAPYR_308 [Paratrimastix pyriformis]|uniref:Right handed beta helix domain-containing protein n=1 Tax=Paratrimastix pyriformis TaxID=342808 RepID=A0ABQ8UVZ4_9EUKA|nr:hypothetical protein PAPYR_308 [Paratrimastix pyriformis]
MAGQSLNIVVSSAQFVSHGLQIDSDVHITSPTGALLRCDPSFPEPFFSLLSHAKTVSFTNLTFSDCRRAALSADRTGNITFTKCSFFNNSNEDTGGAVALQFPASLTFDDCSFGGNSAHGEDGGAVGVVSSCITVRNSRFWNNTAAYRGGAIGVATASTPSTCFLLVEDSNFTGNWAQNGAVIDTYSMDSYTVRGCVFRDNHALGRGDFGGCMDVIEVVHEVLIESSLFEGNSAGHGAGACFFKRCPSVTFRNVTGLGNTAGAWGGFGDIRLVGALRCDAGVFFLRRVSEAAIRGCTFTANSGSGQGGALYALGVDRLAVQQSVFRENLMLAENGQGGACAVDDSGSVLVEGCLFQGNMATHDAGALELHGAAGGEVALRGCHFESNGASVMGGAARISALRVAVTNSTFLANAGGIGGALVAACGQGLFADLLFDDNDGFLGGSIDLDHATATLLRNITVRRSRAGMGGALMTEMCANVTLEQCLFEDNEAAISGGSIYLLGGANITCTDSRFVGSRAASGGGSITSLGVADSTFEGCAFVGSSAFVGGAVQSRYDLDLDYDRCTFTANRAASYGGAMSFEVAEDIAIQRCTFVDQQADEAAGIMVRGGQLVSLTCLNFTRNRAAFGGGGAVFLDAAYNVTLTQSSFVENVAEFGMGGALELSSGSLRVFGSQFIDNQASERDGGGPCLLSPSWCGTGACGPEHPGRVPHRLVCRTNMLQAANQGGAVAISGTEHAEFAGCDFSHNAVAATGQLQGAVGFGGGALSVDSVGLFSLHDASTTAQLAHADFVGNWAKLVGGGAAIVGSIVKASDSGFVDGAATRGGGVYASDSQVNMSRVTISRNQADQARPASPDPSTPPLPPSRPAAD